MEYRLDNAAAQKRQRKARYRAKFSFIMCAWALVFLYFSISSELKYRSVSASPVPVDNEWVSFEITDDEAPLTVAKHEHHPGHHGMTTESSIRNNVSFSSTPQPDFDTSTGKHSHGIGVDSSAGVVRGIPEQNGKQNGKSNGGGRQLKDNEVPGFNCTPPGIDDFPTDIFSKQQRQQGWVIVHFLISIYVFWAIAIVCDDYFVSSIESICDALKMPPDIAGATFMAIATSAPELFTNIIGTFITKGDVGVGTIVGSAVFNILAVAAVCGIGAGMVIRLEWYSVTRDCIFYSISVTLLLIVLKDERIYWYEALVLVLIYVVYIIAMWQNSRLKKGAEALVAHIERRTNNNNDVETTYNMKESGEKEDLDEKDKAKANEELIGNAIKNLQEEAEAEEEESNLCKPPHGKGCLAWVSWIGSWPIMLLYRITIPDCRKAEKQNWYFVTFAMCVAWIAGLSYIVNWMMTIVGDTLGIPDSIMGLTFIAAGTSLPEAVSSIIVARQGLGSMALSNSIGSNTFDILICLGLPWLIRSAMLANANETSYIQINSLGLEYVTMMLITSLIVLYIILYVNKFRLDKRVGFVALLLYCLFLLFACLFELNVFFQVNFETCKYHQDPLDA